MSENNKQFNKDDIEKILSSENIGSILEMLFKDNASNIASFFNAMKIFVSEENKKLLELEQHEHESHKVYVENLKQHLSFLQDVLKDENYKGFDKNDILKMIQKVLEDMKEERHKQRESNERKERELRHETTKRFAIGAAVVGLGAYALSMVLNKGDIGKSIDRASEVTDKFIGK